MEIGFFLIKAQRYFEKRDNSYKHVFVLPLSLQNKKFEVQRYKWFPKSACSCFQIKQIRLL